MLNLHGLLFILMLPLH